MSEINNLIGLNVALPTLSVRDLGEFTVKSGAIRFTDPCYNNDTWCKGSLPAVNGQWQARLGFFRDAYDEKSLKKDIAIKTKAIEIVKSLNYAVNCELSKVSDNLDKFVKEHRPKKIPYRHLDLSDAAKQIVLDIAKYSNESVPSYSWESEGEVQLKTLASVLSLVMGKSHHISDRWSYRIALAPLKKGGEASSTAEQQFNKVQDVLLEALNDCLLSSQKALDEGRPRRTHFLHIKHESTPEFTAFDQNVWIQNDKFDVGVDSGQAGFFDESWYAEYGNEKDDNNCSAKWDEVYSMLGELSLGEPKYNPETGEREEYNYAGVFEFGCNGLTAHGDGSAPLYYRTNEAGEVIEAVYHYDVTCEDEDEEVDQA